MRKFLYMVMDVFFVLFSISVTNNYLISYSLNLYQINFQNKNIQSEDYRYGSRFQIFFLGIYFTRLRSLQVAHIPLSDLLLVALKWLEINEILRTQNDEFSPSFSAFVIKWCVRLISSWINIKRKFVWSKIFREVKILTNMIHWRNVIELMMSCCKTNF